MNRRASILKIAGILLASVGLIALAGYLWIRAIEARRWKEMEATLESLERDVESRPGARPVLQGEPTEGNAWDHYRKAQQLVKSAGQSRLLGEFVSRYSKIDRERALKLIEQLAPAIEEIRKGARCGTAKASIDWRENSSQEVSAHYLTALVASQAREWAAAGRLNDAVVLLVDGVRLGADVGSKAEAVGFLVSMAMLSTTFDELKDLIVDRRTEPADLELIESALGRLDGAFPEPGDALVNATMAMGWEFHRAPSMDEFLDQLYSQLSMTRPKIPTWRFAFSERLLIVDQFETQLDRSRRVAETDGRPWAEAAAAAAQADREIAESKNPLAQVFNAWDRNDRHFSMILIPRERRAQLRLLRVAARYRATGEDLLLADPFGGLLSTSKKEGRLKLWSRGRDGVDDRGSGDWGAREGRDIVLEVTR